MPSTMNLRRLVLPIALATTFVLLSAPAKAEKEASASTPAATAGQSAQSAQSAQNPQSASAKTGTVNINSATSAELARLPRVGSKLADRIVAHRSQHGPFKRVEDLMEVKGVGEKMFTSLKPYLATSGATTLASKVSSAGARTGSSRSAKSGSRKTVAPAAR